MLPEASVQFTAQDQFTSHASNTLRQIFPEVSSHNPGLCCHVSVLSLIQHHMTKLLIKQDLLPSAANLKALHLHTSISLFT